MNDNINENSGGSYEKKLSFFALTAVIIGSTIGSGIFTITADMAASGAHTGAILIGWLICGVGMFCLMMCYFGLNRLRPDLTNGVYSYAMEGFGEFIGFNSAWGYWLSALLCNVSYLTLLFGALGYFFPVFGTGNNLISVVCASVALWILNWLVLRGVEEAAAINIITTIAKLVPVFVFIVAVIFVGAFDPDIFMNNFWGDGTLPISDQIKATTTATVWSFIGIEGAVVLSGRAKRAKDVGKSSLVAFIGILAIYVMVAVLSMGVMTTEEMAALDNPQMAGILEKAVGPWGAAMINIGVILSLAGALLGWTILAADCSYSAAKQGVFMRAFTRTNSKNSPSFALFLTNGIIQAFLVICFFNDATYQAFYILSASMIMLPYLFSAAYYLKLTMRGEGFEEGRGGNLLLTKIFAVIGTIYGVWMLYSSGLDYLLITTVLYAPGLIVYYLGKKERGLPTFNHKAEMWLAVALVAAAVVSIVMIGNGSLSPF